MSSGIIRNVIFSLAGTGFGYWLGKRWGVLSSIVGASFGSVIGFFAGKALTVKTIPPDVSAKSVLTSEENPQKSLVDYRDNHAKTYEEELHSLSGSKSR